jgi:hypothetical protein
VLCEIEAHDTTTDIDAAAKALGLDRDWFEPRGYPSIATAAAATRPRNSDMESRARKAALGTRSI